MERVFPVTDDIRMKRMEALVHDLSTALDESSRTSTTRRRWGMRRRARSTGNLPSALHKTPSDDSSSSIGGEGHVPLSHDLGLSSLHQSDSDEACTSMQRQLVPFSLTARRVAHLHGNLESDSFNENFSPVHPNTRRKRKLKRMAAETSGPEHASTSRAILPVSIHHQPVTACAKKKRILRHAPNCENRLINSFLCGKRKRSLRERSLDCGLEAAAGRGRSRGSPACHKTAMTCDDTRMDCSTSDNLQCEMMSSSSLSSSESDNGIYTNDEGREGDDEQSDWIGESSLGQAGGKGWWEEESDNTDQEDESTMSLMFGPGPAGEQHKQCRETASGREIRSGRRRVRSDRPGFSIVTSANEKLSRFLQDPAQLRLKLHPMQRREREQLCHLANLYSLELTSELACPILTKTRQTVRVEPMALNRLRLHHGLADCKRRRWMPPHSILAPPIFNLTPAQSYVGSASCHLPSVSSTNQMRGMSWEAGPSNASPIQTAGRPKLSSHDKADTFYNNVLAGHKSS